MTHENSSYKSFLDIADNSARHMTAKLRLHAYHNGWPSDISRKLTVKHDGGDNFYADYPKNIENDILNLEQGNQNTPPNAAILRFMNRADDYINDYVNRMFHRVFDRNIFG